MSKKWVYLYNEIGQAEKYVGNDWDAVRGLLGGKGANLAEMARTDIPVPPGFTVTTEACNAYLEAGGRFPEGLWDQVLASMKAIEKTTGRKFGDAANPLLVSCRSGAKFSMPGMMDTVLNIGLNLETAAGMTRLTGDERFVYDTYRRLIQMFGTVVIGVADEAFEKIITDVRRKAQAQTDAELTAEDWKEVSSHFLVVLRRMASRDFPMDPYEQLKLAIEAVFESWNGKRAVDYRNAAGIPQDLGTAVNIVAMVFGNTGRNSATGVAMTRNSTTGEKKIEGDYLDNAQGEDVVAGIRLTKDISQLKEEMPSVYAQLEDIAQRLEKHYRDMQDMEFTIENGKLWMLQTRDGKRSAPAAVRIAASLADEGLIDRREAVMRVTPDQVDFFLHPQFDHQARQAAKTSAVPDIKDPWVKKILAWADEFRRLGVRANADYPQDAKRALDYGAEGIGLCRTEHMFFETNRLPHIQKMILTDLPSERREALDALLAFQIEDFIGLFKVMDGLPVIIRLIDPPLHEFLPAPMDLMRDLSDLKIRMMHAKTLTEIDELLEQIESKEKIFKRAQLLHETNPMLGLRGVRLGMHIPELTAMQVRAIFEAACLVSKEGLSVRPEVMIPLTSHVNELRRQREVLEVAAKEVLAGHGLDINYKFGTMIEIPRAAITADRMAQHADFFSFGTNDLTQTVYGISRDDAEAGFLMEYISSGILSANPFATIDPDGVGELIKIAVTKGRSKQPGLECGICGEHGGDPESIMLCHEIGLTYVSCSPFRVPIARLAAAHAALREK